MKTLPWNDVSKLEPFLFLGQAEKSQDMTLPVVKTAETSADWRKKEHTTSDALLLTF